MQSDDFHLDRPLFFACKNDRKTLCPKVISGDGRIFQCLLSHKEDNEMSKECRVQLSRRQKLMRENYKVSRGLVRACKTEIKENQCKSKASGSGSQIKTVKLAAILLCLEGMYFIFTDCIVLLCQKILKNYWNCLQFDLISRVF